MTANAGKVELKVCLELGSLEGLWYIF